MVQRLNKLNISKSEELDNFKAKNKDVFEGLGTFPDLVQIKLVEEAVPKANPSRRVPLALKPRLEQTLKELTNKNIIEPVNEPLEWVNNIVIVEKPNKTLRV